MAETQHVAQASAASLRYVVGFVSLKNAWAHRG